MQLDCVEYLLKPIDCEAVNRAVGKAVGKYHEVSGAREDSDRLAAQNLFSMLLASPKDENVFAKLCGIAPWLAEESVCRIGVVSLQHLSKESITQYEVHGMVMEYLFQNHIGIAAVWGGSSDIVMLIRGGYREESVKTVCCDILNDIRRKTGLILHAGISGEALCPAGVTSGTYKVNINSTPVLPRRGKVVSAYGRCIYAYLYGHPLRGGRLSK